MKNFIYYFVTYLLFTGLPVWTIKLDKEIIEYTEKTAESTETYVFYQINEPEVSIEEMNIPTFPFLNRSK